MTKESLKRLISEISGFNLSQITDNADLKNDLLLSSVKAMLLVAEIENDLGYSLDYGAFRKINTVEELWSLTGCEALKNER